MSRQRCIISVRSIKKLAKTDQPLFFAVLRQVGSPKNTRNKSTYELDASHAQALTKGNKHGKMKLEGPKKGLQIHSAEGTGTY